MNTNNNTVSGLRRAVNGTAVATVNVAGSRVIDCNSKYDLPAEARTTVWTTPGNNTASNGQGLAASTTPVAVVLIDAGTVLP